MLPNLLSNFKISFIPPCNHTFKKKKKQKYLFLIQKKTDKTKFIKKFTIYQKKNSILHTDILIRMNFIRMNVTNSVTHTNEVHPYV